MTTNVSGASIKVASGSEIKADGTATGTASGAAFTTPKLPNGTYTITVSKEGYEDANEAVSIVNGDVSVDVPLVEKPIVASAISEITTNTATVVLAAAPAKELTATDFKVSGNTVTKIEKGNFNTVYTLTLGTSLDNTKGTLTVNGASKDYDFTQLKINSVKAKNLRQLEVTFSKDLKLPTTTDADGVYDVTGNGSTTIGMLDKLHIWMTKEEKGATATYSLRNILNTNANKWKAYVQPTDKKTVIIESIDGSLLTSAAGTGLDLKKNETYEVEALNVLDAEGKYSDVSYATDILQDTVRPAVKNYAGTTHTVIRDDNDTSNANSNLLKISFTEPMNGFGATTKAKIYIDGKEIDTTNTNLFTDVKASGKVSEHSVVSINIGNSEGGLKLEKGEHTFAIVGAEDLNGNVVSDNTKEYKFTVVDPTEQASVTPEVTSVYQVADNAFKVVFNTSKVVAKSEGTVVTIKKGAYDSNAGTPDYKDITVAGKITVGDSSADNIVYKEISADASKNITAHTEWLVVVDATPDTDAAKLSYKGANVMNKDIEIDNFQVSSGKDGKKTTKTLTFKKDINAPVIKDAKDAITSSGSKINIQFTDDPFTEAADIDVPTSHKKVTVKYVNDKGVTYSQDIEVDSIATDNKSIDLNITNSDMLDKNNNLIAGGKYTIVLPDAVITDKEEESGVGSLNYLILDKLHPFVGKTVEYTVPGVLTAAGSVPQTTRGMIFTGYEVSKATSDSSGNLVEKVKNANKITLKDNQIVVVFDCDGNLDAATVNNKDNYTLNGKVFPKGTTVEYREANIDGVAGNEKFALITLPDDTVSLTGGQDFTVQNVANKEGYKMMPVADVITLADNTAPVIKAIEVVASNKITITFSEEVKTTMQNQTDMTQLARNFVITANGKTVSLDNAVIDTDNKKKMTITTADNFADSSLNVPVSITIKKDYDGNIFVEDMAGNKAAEMTFTK